mmetsp:Transcript_14630/g.26533  ORF Transcript_14630/g.26533 Transcript_14630/m.26533 type:complete len:145 (-) Transcript_14630:20-454(-)
MGRMILLDHQGIRMTVDHTIMQAVYPPNVTRIVIIIVIAKGTAVAAAAVGVGAAVLVIMIANEQSTIIDRVMTMILGIDMTDDDDMVIIETRSRLLLLLPDAIEKMTTNLAATINEIIIIEHDLIMILPENDDDDTEVEVEAKT